MAVRQSLLAEQEVAARRRGDHALYVAHMNLAQAACDNHDLATAEHYLGLHADDDLRTFEWFHWWHVCHEGHVATLPADRVCATVAISPDGRTLAYERTKTRLRSTIFASGAEMLSGHTARILDIKFSPRGEWLASCGYDGRIILWDTKTATPLRTIEGSVLSDGKSPSPVSGVAFSPDGKAFAAACHDGFVRSWSMVDGKLVSEIAAARKKAADGDSPRQPVQAVAYSTDGKLIATAGGTHLPAHRHIVVRRVADGGEVFRDDRLAHQVHRLAFSPDGRRLATFGPRGANGVGRRGLETDRADPQPAQSQMLAVAFSPDGKCLAAAGHDGQIHCWDTTTKRVVRSLPGHRQLVADLAFTPESRTLASAGYDRTVRLWDLGASRAVERVEAHDAALDRVEFTDDGRTTFLVGCQRRSKVLEHCR